MPKSEAKSEGETEEGEDEDAEAVSTLKLQCELPALGRDTVYLFEETGRLKSRWGDVSAWERAGTNGCC
jgi:hypothetical protein